jgi:spermidine synthase
MQNIMYFLVITFLVFGIHAHSLDSDDTTVHDPAQDAKRMVDWLVNEHQGRVLDSIDIRAVQNDKYGIPEFRMFATEDIKEGETILYIPTTSVISSRKVIARKEEEDEEDPKQDCRTVHNMVDEYLKAEDKTARVSRYQPYMRYIFEGYGTFWGRMINTWSDQAYKIFFATLIRGEVFPTQRWMQQFYFHRYCGTESIDPKTGDSGAVIMAKRRRKSLLKRAYYYFLANSRGDSIIPLLDMIPHRNGNWTNVDAKVIHKRAIVVYALRDIPRGELLYTSVNECKELGCDEAAEEYMTQHIFAHRGVLEDYPRRWLFECEEGVDGLDLILDVDELDGPSGTKERVVHWRGSLPNTFQWNWIRAQLRRLQRLNQTLHDEVAELKSPYERNAILAFYEGFVDALDDAWANRKGDSPQIMDVGAAHERQYDSLVESKNSAVVPMDNFHVCTSDPVEDDRDSFAIYTIEEDQSHYQYIRFSYNSKQDDTSLTLANWLQTSSSSRAHYHEAFVHPAASFVKDLKRIIYIGGGDNMLLHEFMKYKDLELVVGIELDQKVSRLSFKHFGNSPLFNDPRIQWWFGDATKALYALPEEYFGSFDLVLVDLLTFVADTVKVTDDLTIMEAAALLMKPDGGVIARQEDFSVRSYNDVAKYVVELEWRDLPFLCELSITFESDSVDFINTEPTDHGIETFARPISLSHKHESPKVRPFYAWNKFRQLAQESCDTNSIAMAEAEISGKDSFASGVLMIIEAENATMASESISTIISTVKDVLTKSKFVEQTVSISEANPNTAVFVLEEGYVVVRVAKENGYIGFDLAMWDRFEDLDKIGRNLVEAVKGDFEASTSSFNVVTGGILGRKSVGRTNMLARMGTSSQQGTCNVPVGIDYDSTAQDTVAEEPIVGQEVLRTMLPFGNKSSHAIAVLCGHPGENCSSLETANVLTSSENQVKVLAIYACAPSEDLPSCEDKTAKQMTEYVTTYQKFDGIIFDSKMPFKMGQVMHKIFNETRNFDHLLKEGMVVLSPVTRGETWRRELVDRFRTEMVLLEPAFRSDFALVKAQEQHLWSVFSSVEDQFFYRLTQGLSNIVDESSFESYSVWEVTNGMKNLMPDFVPSPAKTNDSSWDKTDAARQWKSQFPIGFQSVMQFTPRIPKVPLTEGEIVLYVVDSEDEAFMKAYGLAVVVDTDETDGENYFLRGINDDDDLVVKIHRDLIRKLTDVDGDHRSREYKPGDMILYDDVDGVSEGMFHNGVITERTGEHEYSLYLLNFHKTVLHNVSSDLLLMMAESPEFAITPDPLERPVLVDAFEHALVESMQLIDESQLFRESVKIGDGAIEVALWSGGHAVMKWNGATTLEVNLFLAKEDLVVRNEFVGLLKEKVPNLITTMMDEFPRGTGRVVNLVKEMHTDPIWLSKYDGSLV